ncbi:hypothetical protein F4782DRAFT_546736 [Xylaria castorea]|nr:hypothetical protein F4782DRAFT_546736 [Xylaria castorea]
MPKPKHRVQKTYQILMVFKSLMIRLERKLKVEGQGRDQKLDREMAKQFCRVTDEMAYRRRGQSLLYFGWCVYKGLSNHFWPASVMPEDRPSIIQESTKPFLCVDRFEALDTYAMSFEQIVDYIQCNGDGYSRWPKKSKWQRKLERDARKEQHLMTKLNGLGGDRSNPIVISPVRSTLPRTPVTFSILGETHSFSPLPPCKVYDIPNIPAPSRHRTRLTPTSIDPWARNLQDEDIEMVEAPPLEKTCVKSTARSQIPRLSVICQPGWDLNNKTIWIPASGIKYDNHVVPCRTGNAQPLGPVEPSIGPVLFNKVPEKDVEAFLSSFLGSGDV